MSKTEITNGYNDPENLDECIMEMNELLIKIERIKSQVRNIGTQIQLIDEGEKGDMVLEKTENDLMLLTKQLRFTYGAFLGFGGDEEKIQEIIDRLEDIDIYIE